MDFMFDATFDGRDLLVLFVLAALAIAARIMWERGRIDREVEQVLSERFDGMIEIDGNLFIFDFKVGRDLHRERAARPLRCATAFREDLDANRR